MSEIPDMGRPSFVVRPARPALGNEAKNMVSGGLGFEDSQV